MIEVPNPNELSDFNLDEYQVEKEVDRRGYLYILEDDVFPNYIKVGRTSNVQKRLYGYNSDKPYNTARMTNVSIMLKDSYVQERKVLQLLYDTTSPTTLSREWFMKEHRDLIKKTIERIEEAEKTESDVYLEFK